MLCCKGPVAANVRLPDTCNSYTPAPANEKSSEPPFGLTFFSTERPFQSCSSASADDRFVNCTCRVEAESERTIVLTVLVNDTSALTLSGLWAGFARYRRGWFLAPPTGTRPSFRTTIGMDKKTAAPHLLARQQSRLAISADAVPPVRVLALVYNDYCATVTVLQSTSDGYGCLKGIGLVVASIHSRAVTVADYYQEPLFAEKHMRRSFLPGRKRSA